MKTTILAAIIGIIFSTPALARSDYQNATRKLEICKYYGLYGEAAYVLKEQGDAFPNKKGSDYTAPLMDYALKYGYYAATNQQDANRGAWAYCMDNLDRLGMEENERLRNR